MASRTPGSPVDPTTLLKSKADIQRDIERLTSEQTLKVGLHLDTESATFAQQQEDSKPEPHPDAACVTQGHVEQVQKVPKKSKKGFCFHMSDGEVIDMLEKGEVRQHELEELVAHPTEGLTSETCARAVKIRRMHMASKMQLENLPHEHYDYKQVFGACCESVIGFVPLPVGVVTSFIIDGKEYNVPMATTEGCLVASTQRGAKSLSVNGVNTVLINDGMTRAPVVEMPNAKRASDLKQWIEDNFDLIAAEFNSTSRFARLKEIKCAVAGRKVFVRFKCVTGDAMGMNMISKATDKAMVYLSEHFEDMEILSLSGNFCTDKKPSAINWIEGRGKSVVADCIVPKEVVEKVLKADVDSLVHLNINKNLVGSAMAGSVGGFNAHASNIVTAVFIATGQDAAQNVESSNCMTLMEKTADGDLYISCTMPSIEVGTVGGGTVLAPQMACLDMLGIRGAHKENPGQNAQRLARIVCSMVMAGELSLMSALVSGDLVKSHMKHNRGASNK